MSSTAVRERERGEGARARALKSQKSAHCPLTAIIPLYATVALPYTIIVVKNEPTTVRTIYDVIPRSPWACAPQASTPAHHLDAQWRSWTAPSAPRYRCPLNSLQGQRLREFYELRKDVRHEVQLVDLCADKVDVLHDALPSKNRPTIETLVRRQQTSVEGSQDLQMHAPGF